MQVPGINRRGETLRRKMSQIRLSMGDLLLVQGDRVRIATIVIIMIPLLWPVGTLP